MRVLHPIANEIIIVLDSEVWIRRIRRPNLRSHIGVGSRDSDFHPDRRVLSRMPSISYNYSKTIQLPVNAVKGRICSELEVVVCLIPDVRFGCSFKKLYSSLVICWLCCCKGEVLMLRHAPAFSYYYLSIVSQVFPRCYFLIHFLLKDKGWM